jgi:nitrate reductase gamma subunit
MAVIVLFLITYVGVGAIPGLEWLFGVIIPYAAFALFVVGFIVKILQWAKVPIPFRIPTTGGQQQSLPWFKPSRFDNPFSKGAVFVRMVLEVFAFRSLFRNTRMSTKEGRITYQMEIFLWLGALAFHYAFFTVLFRHLRFFTEPVPVVVQLVENLDSFFRMELLYDVARIGVPGVYLSGLVLLAAVTFLFLRRILIRHMKYISLASDYFPLLLIFGIAFTGIMMRYFTKIDVAAAKELTMGLVTFQPTIPQDIGAIFYVHLFFVSVLAAYFPFSKLMHLGGIFMSPTRNMTADTRMSRHVNPWNYPVEVHTYSDYEDDFREKMIEAELPVEKMPEEAAPEEPAEQGAPEESADASAAESEKKE